MKIGLVLAGGGARGAYQIGVWRAFKELGIDKYISVISGTSIGALNAVLINQGDIDIAEKVWNGISIEKIFPTDEKDLLKRSILLTIGSKNLNFIKKYIPRAISGGNVSRSGLNEILDNYIDFSKIINGKNICYAACTEIPKMESKYFRLNNYNEEDIRKILLATSALPMIYEAEEIEGKKYLDGGMVDNIPIQPVYGEGCDIIIIVPLAMDTTINRDLYPNSQILEIKPSEMEEGFIDGALEFTVESAKRRMRIGYNDTLNQLEPIINIALMIERERIEKQKEEKKKKMLFNILREKLFGEQDKKKNNKENDKEA